MYLSTKSVLEAEWFQHLKHQRLNLLETEKKIYKYFRYFTLLTPCLPS